MSSRWLAGFAVLGSLLVLPALLPVTKSFELDVDPGQPGLRFFAFNFGFLAASLPALAVVKKFGIRPLAALGLALAIICLSALTLEAPLLPFWSELLLLGGIGSGAGCLSMGCLFALKPWSSRVGAHALPAVVELFSVGCIFSCLAAGAAVGLGWGRFGPLAPAAGALFCLVLLMSGRQPLGVVERHTAPRDIRTRQRRSIASFLVLCVLFVQLGSEWTVAGWLALFVIHRLGSGPSAAVFVLAAYFFLLVLGRFLARWMAGRAGSRLLAATGAGLALTGCLILGFSNSLWGMVIGLLVLGVGFAPPYSIIQNVLDETFDFAPEFYRMGLLMAVTGAMCAAWTFAYVHQLLGIGALFLFPAAGSIVILVLELLLIFDAHLMSEREPALSNVHAAGRRS